MDNGGEFVNDEVNKYTKGKFLLRTTPPHTPESNATSERFNRVLGERTRAMLKDKQLPLFLWPEAMKTITYLSNRTTTVAVGNKILTPFEILNDIKPDIAHLRVFGCKAFAYNFDIARKKLDDKAKPGVLQGYDLTSSAYRIHLSQQGKVIKSGSSRVATLSSMREVRTAGASCYSRPWTAIGTSDWMRMGTVNTIQTMVVTL